MDKPLIFIMYFSFLFMVAIATMLRGEREFIRKEKAYLARREAHKKQLAIEKELGGETK
jgi:hypothetical protein